MIFLYEAAPLIASLAVTFPAVFKAIRHRESISSLGCIIVALFPPFTVLLALLFMYVPNVMIIGGELPINFVVVLVRIGLALLLFLPLAVVFSFIKLDKMELEWYFTVYYFFYYILIAVAYIITPRTLAIARQEVLSYIILALFVLVVIVYAFLFGGVTTEYGEVEVERPGWLFILIVLAIATGAVSCFIGPPGGTSVGMPFVITPMILFIVVSIVGHVKNKVKSHALLILLIILASLLVIPPCVTKNKVDDAWTFTVNMRTDISDFPINITYVRLVDRALARDFAESFRLPKIGPYQLEVKPEYENIGLVNGKPAWVLPVYYAGALTREINKMVGYLYIYLDTPTFESMQFVHKEMLVAPGLKGAGDIFYHILNLVPEGVIGEIYLIDPSPVTSSPAWVVLVDTYTPAGLRVPYKVVIVGAQGDAVVMDWRDATGVVPQVVSHVAFETIAMMIGGYMREWKKDYFARGFIWIPTSQDLQEPLAEDFYKRAHHFLTGAIPQWGRDFYMAIRTLGGETSIAIWTLIRDEIYMYDLRFYIGIGGVARGVNPPTTALEAIKQVVSEEFPFPVNIRYPKLYKVRVGSEEYLVWLALVAQELPGADKPLGVAWVDASNPRICGFVQYVYGEPHKVFMERLNNNIYASYIGWKSGNATLVTAIINGTIIRKNWCLMPPDNEYAIVMAVQNETDVVTVIVMASKTATMQDFYNAVLAEEGDWVEIEARWDIDLQAWVAYTVKLYPRD